MNNVVNIVEKGMCCGCGACVNTCPKGAIHYSKDKYGFIIPVIDENNCVECGLCIEKCPDTKVVKKTPIVAYAAINTDDNIRFNSSSGGIFYALASNFIAKGGVVCGCVMDDHFKVHHVIIEKESDLRQIQKSKYVQSFMGNIYHCVKEYLSQKRAVLFSGTPCQVSALNNYLSEDNKQYLLTVDIVCHGVPSQDLFDSYLSYLKQKKGDIEEYQFRTKKEVDGGMTWYTSYRVPPKKRVVFGWTEDSYNYLYMMMLTNRDSCYSCKYASIERASDITLCDFWNWEKYHTKLKAGASVSGILVNTQTGQRIFNEISSRLFYEQTSPEYIAAANGALVEPSGNINERNAVLDAWVRDGYTAISNDFSLKHKKDILKGQLRRALPKSFYSVISKVKHILISKK